MGLCHFLEQFRQGEALGLSLNKVIETSLIRYVASSELFLTVATKSAFEILLSQICGELGLGKWPPLMWLGDVDTSSFSIFSPETNILRSTTAVMGLCLSGVDWVTVPEYRIQTNPIESDEVLRKQIADTRRAARAQFLLLKNEARAVTPEHPMQGAWFAEHLVAELVEAGASWLRKIESQGGLIAALANGWIEAMVQEQFEVKNQKLLTSESKLVGVNCFLDEGQDFKKIHSSLTESLSLFAQGSRKDLKARRNPFVIEESVVAKAGAK
jgi:methylmalonyl-CoA mutase